MRSRLDPLLLCVQAVPSSGLSAPDRCQGSSNADAVGLSELHVGSLQYLPCRTYGCNCCLQIEWREEDGHVYMTGPAELVFSGSFSLA